VSLEEEWQHGYAHNARFWLLQDDQRPKVICLMFHLLRFVHIPNVLSEEEMSAIIDPVSFSTQRRRHRALAHLSGY